MHQASLPRPTLSRHKASLRLQTTAPNIAGEGSESASGAGKGGRAPAEDGRLANGGRPSQDGRHLSFVAEVEKRLIENVPPPWALRACRVRIWGRGSDV